METEVDVTKGNEPSRTSGEQSDARTWLIRTEAVRNSIHELYLLKIHESFAAYLCLKRIATREGKLNDLEHDFPEFFETFLMVPGGPNGFPYLRPFSYRLQSSRKIWFNKNVAGSFAPSSLRTGGPFFRVVTVTGRGRKARYKLKPRHWMLARQHLTYGEQIPITPLVTFLYRDFGLRPPNPPNMTDLIVVFRQEFGYESPEGDKEFRHLYLDESVTRVSSEWFEAI